LVILKALSTSEISVLFKLSSALIMYGLLMSKGL